MKRKKKNHKEEKKAYEIEVYRNKKKIILKNIFVMKE